MKEVRLKGIHRIEVRDDKRELDVADLEIRYARCSECCRRSASRNATPPWTSS